MSVQNDIEAWLGVPDSLRKLDNLEGTVQEKIDEGLSYLEEADLTDAALGIVAEGALGEDLARQAGYILAGIVAPEALVASAINVGGSISDVVDNMEETTRHARPPGFVETEEKKEEKRKRRARLKAASNDYVSALKAIPVLGLAVIFGEWIASLFGDPVGTAYFHWDRNGKRVRREHFCKDWETFKRDHSEWLGDMSAEEWKAKYQRIQCAEWNPRRIDEAITAKDYPAVRKFSMMHQGQGDRIIAGGPNPSSTVWAGVRLGDYPQWLPLEFPEPIPYIFMKGYGQVGLREPSDWARIASQNPIYGIARVGTRVEDLPIGDRREYFRTAAAIALAQSMAYPFTARSKVIRVEEMARKAGVTFKNGLLREDLSNSLRRLRYALVVQAVAEEHLPKIPETTPIPKKKKSSGGAAAVAATAAAAAAILAWRATR